MTSSKKLLWGAVLGCAIGGATVLWPARALSDATSINVPIDSVADYIHAVIAADREVYTKHAVERMQTNGVVAVSEKWEERNTLPLPAQFLQESGRYVGKMGVGVQYRLISFWPINKRNVAANALESIGLAPWRLIPIVPTRASRRSATPDILKQSMPIWPSLRIVPVATMLTPTVRSMTSSSMTSWVRSW